MHHMWWIQKNLDFKFGEREREMVLKVCDFGSENVCRGTLHELILSTFSACHKLKESN